jgi:CheY-like chemotaxis protein
MSSGSILKDKVVLVVDDEPDVLEAVSELLDMCRVYTAQDYDSAIQLLVGYTFDIVILDIMGVDGFKLLKSSVRRGFPTVMLTAHALTPEAIKQSIKLGAVSFLPKDKMHEIDVFLEDVVLGGGKSAWGKLFERLGSFFNQRFGPDWKEQDAFFKNFEKALKSESGDRQGSD